MNLENIREIRSVEGEEKINELLTTGKWKVLTLMYGEDGVIATPARVRA